MTTNQDPAAVVRAFHEAWTTGDLDAAFALVADDVVCHAPGEEFRGAAAYRAFLEGFVPMLTGVPEVDAFVRDDRVALIYYPQTAVTTTTAACEYFTVRDGRIVEDLLMFDRLSYAPPSAPGEGPA